jgi:REP element-mobilizing transposase RayT
MTLPKFDEASYAHFVTTKTFENKPIFKDKKCCEISLKDIDFYRNKLGFKLIGYVIMPNHLHLIVWWDVEKYPKLTISKVMHGIKGLSAQNLSRHLLGSRGVSASTISQGAKALAYPG